MNKQLLQEVVRLREIMGVPSRPTQLITERQLLTEQWRSKLFGGTAKLLGLTKHTMKDVVKLVEGMPRIDFTKVSKLDLNNESVKLLRNFDDFLAAESKFVGPAPGNWKLTMGDEFVETYPRASTLLDDFFDVGTTSTDVMRAINRMRTAADPSAVVKAAAEIEDFWKVYRARLAGARKPFGDRTTTAGMFDVSSTHPGVNDIIDELHLIDDLPGGLGSKYTYFDDLAKTSKVDDTKTVITKGDDAGSTVITKGDDAADIGKHADEIKNLKSAIADLAAVTKAAKDSVNVTKKGWKWYMWRALLGIGIADALIPRSLRLKWAGIDDAHEDEEIENKRVDAFNPKFWKEQWDLSGNDKNWADKYLIDGWDPYDTPREPTGKLLEIVEFLHQELTKPKGSYEITPNAWLQINEKAIASLYGGPQGTENVVPKSLYGTQGGIINSVLKASQVAWAFDEFTLENKSLRDLMRDQMKATGGGTIGAAIRSQTGEDDISMVYTKLDDFEYGYPKAVDGKTDKEDVLDKKIDIKLNLKDASPEWINKKYEDNSFWCCNYSELTPVPFAVASLNLKYIQGEYPTEGHTLKTANEDTLPTVFNDHFDDIYPLLQPAYEKVQPGNEDCSEEPKGKIDDIDEQISTYADAIEEKIAENNEEDDNE